VSKLLVGLGMYVNTCSDDERISGRAERVDERFFPSSMVYTAYAASQDRSTTEAVVLVVGKPMRAMCAMTP
jgi:hypothetical protein